MFRQFLHLLSLVKEWRGLLNMSHLFSSMAVIYNALSFLASSCTGHWHLLIWLCYPSHYRECSPSSALHYYCPISITYTYCVVCLHFSSYLSTNNGLYTSSDEPNPPSHNPPPHHTPLEPKTKLKTKILC